MTFPSTIEALSFAKTGGVEVMEKITIPFPKQSPDGIIVKVMWHTRCLDIINLMKDHFQR